MRSSKQPLQAPGLATLSERRAGMTDARLGSGVELIVDHLYKVTGASRSGRQFRIHAITAERILATEGRFEREIPKQFSPGDPWVWSNTGERWIPREALSWSRDVGRIPDAGEPRFRFRWGMERG
jgi:hypothetical protein